MWVYEEEVTISEKSRHYNADSELCKSPQKLSEVINKIHENVKYLPGITLPENVIANPSLPDACKNSTILIFNLPHQFIHRIAGQLEGHLLPYARGVSCIKGVEVSEKGVTLLSELIAEKLGVYCGALSGANIASEVALEKWSETTVAYEPPAKDSQADNGSGTEIDFVLTSKLLSGEKKSVKLQALPADYPPLSHENMRRLFHRPYFHVRMVSDVAGVSLGGALKNIIALAAGYVDGLGWGDNAKAAIMRVGILEMVKFGNEFFADSAQSSSFTEESCGVADVITSCMGGRNMRCAKLSVQRGVPINEIEKTELNGQVLQGTSTAYEVNALLKTVGKEADFPLFTAVYSKLPCSLCLSDRRF